MIETTELSLTQEDHDKAFIEISFLLEIFAETIAELMGGATATVGRIAGRHMAEKLPIYLPDPTLSTVLTEMIGVLESGYEITFKCDENGADLQFGKCAIREICRVRNQQIGGDVCKVFHYTIAGIVNQLMNCAVRGSIESTGESCVMRIEMK